MRDKLIVIATIQNLLNGVQVCLNNPKRGEKQRGVLMGLMFALRYMYTAITNQEWTQSPKDLQEWMLKYVKDEVRLMESRN